MNIRMLRPIAMTAFFVFAVALIVWTSSLTVSFIQQALPHSGRFTPYFGLVLFDGGMIVWLFVFIFYAQGMGQRVTAFLICLIDFIGVGLLGIAEILLGGQEITQAPEMLGSFAVWGIGIWTILNVGAGILFHLNDPEAKKQMLFQSELDEIWTGGFNELKKNRKDNQNALAGMLGSSMFNQLEALVNKTVEGLEAEQAVNVTDKKTAANKPVVIDHESIKATEPKPTQAVKPTSEESAALHNAMRQASAGTTNHANGSGNAKN